MDNTDHKLDNRVKARSEDPLWHLHEYDVDLQSNHIYLFGNEKFAGHDSDPGVEYSMANRFIRNINLCMRANPQVPVLIHMKTPGGDFSEGMAIYDAIKSCPFPVTILNYAHASSMSSIIFQAANKRVMMPHSHFMFHDGNLGYSGTYKQVISQVEWDKNGREIMIQIYENSLKRTGRFSKKSREWIREWIVSQMDKKEDVYLTAKDSVSIGFADCVFDYNWEKLTQYSEEELRRG
jgi:ATP-dependent protease ClpP protease subunit